ncbi:MAG: sulfatase-like hydrolase/transferase [Bacteroidia bacterium]|nr:sulfatase-like hydrolase/transferase [Bacteroidia bacterium]
MNRVLSYFLITSLVLTSCKDDENGTSGLPGTSSTHPNILLIIADDMGIDACPGYSEGSVKPNMPHLEELIRNGVTYDNVWAYPLCAPTRASILTGKHGYNTGVLNVTTHNNLSESETTIQRYLDQNTSKRYAHAIFGKWHLSNDANSATNMGVGTYAGLLRGALSNYNEWSFTENGTTNTYTGYATTKFTDLAINWINDQSKPWFCWLAYTTPHTPFHLPPGEMHSQGSLPEDQASIDQNPQPYFMAMIESLDYELGRIKDSLSQAEWDNTLIVFIGDNGTLRSVIQNPFGQRQGKGTIYQGGVNVPMIVSGSGVTRSNEHDASLICSTDLFATIASIAGVDVNTYEDSYSFSKTFTQAGAGVREYAYTEQATTDFPNQFTVRNDRYKLVQFDDTQREFYDLEADAYEKADLLQGNLSNDQQAALTALEAEANRIRQ